MKLLNTINGTVQLRTITDTARSKRLRDAGVATSGGSSGGSFIPGSHLHSIDDVVQLKTELEKRLLKAVFDENFSVTDVLVEILKDLKVNGSAEITGNVKVLGEIAGATLDGLQIAASDGVESRYLNDLLDVNITNPIIAQYLRYNGTEWANAKISYNDLTDRPTIPSVPSWALQASKPSYGWTEIGSKPTTFPPSTHSHAISDVSGLQGALDGKSPTHSHPYRANTWVPAWGDVTGKPTSMPASDVYAWAKQSTKPSYSYSEVGAAPASHTHNVLYADDDRSVKPNTSGLNGAKAIKFYFTRLDNLGTSAYGTYADFMLLDTYSDNSGGVVNGLAFSKNSQNAEMFIIRSAWNAAAWQECRRVWHDGNSGTSAYDWTARHGTFHGNLKVLGEVAGNTLDALQIKTTPTALYAQEQQQEALLMMSAEITKLRDRVYELERKEAANV